MREARIILPQKDNNGKLLTPVHDALKRELARLFGGYTATASFGGWLSNTGHLFEEPGTAYDIAIKESDDGKLRLVAVNIGTQAKQEAMYFRNSHGDVEIIPLAQQEAA